MEYLIGTGLAVVVCAFATLVGFDRDRVFYPTLTVIATYYIVWASLYVLHSNGAPNSGEAQEEGAITDKTLHIGHCYKPLCSMLIASQL